FTVPSLVQKWSALLLPDARLAAASLRYHRTAAQTVVPMDHAGRLGRQAARFAGLSSGPRTTRVRPRPGRVAAARTIEGGVT
ncbi:MAG TPA: hypothetical protein VF580_14295, partial [Thermoanaerobaculia bacterium]